ncbi:protein containing PilT protein, partial [mine drainage metagenome]
HEKAKEGLERIDNGFLPSVVVEELVHVLERLKFDKKVISEKIGEVLDTYEVLSIGENEILEAKDSIMKESVSFKKFNDKLILSTAKREDLPLFTFDEGLVDECKANGIKPFVIT